MSSPIRSLVRPWLVIPLAAAGFLVWVHLTGIARTQTLSGSGDQPAAADPSSPTGYQGGTRELIVPNHDVTSYQWIAQAQLSVTSGSWRIRHVDYDNAPFGREVLTPSPYRWWLIFVGWFDHLSTGRSMPLAIEHAALFADPALQLLWLAVAVVLIARWFGAFAAVLQAIALGLAFPLNGTFVAGAPRENGMALIAAWAGMVALIKGVKALDAGRNEMAVRWFAASGAIGGIALWLDPVTQMVYGGGTALGGVLWAAVQRPRAAAAAPATVAGKTGEIEANAPIAMNRAESEGQGRGSFRLSRVWLSWSAAGAAATLVCFALEYSPNHMAGWHLEYIHPLWGIAWLGLGGLLAAATAWLESGQAQFGWRRTAMIIGAAGALGVPIYLLIRQGGAGALTASLTLHPPLLPGSLSTESLWSWVGREGFTAAAAVVLLPVLILIPAIWVVLRRRKRAPAAALALGPVLVTLGFGLFQLCWLSAFDAAVALLLIGVAADLPSRQGEIGGIATSAPRKSAVLPSWLGWAGGAVVALVPSSGILIHRTSGDGAFSESDVVALVDRDVSHWLANRAGPAGAVVLAPPALTTSIYFHGGLKGLGTPYWDNKAGLEASVRIAGASSPDEGLALAQKRGVGYIVLPSWDSALDTFVRATSNQADHSVLALLHQLRPPRWLRPVPYSMPQISGFEDRSITVFQVVDVQDNATALSRLAEYFVEMQRMREAMAVGITLERSFPNDLGACIARAQVAAAVNDPDQFAAAFRGLTRESLAASEASLPWDQRVSLAIVLAEAKDYGRAREELQRCLADVNENRLRFLTPTALYQFQLLCKLNHLEIADAALRELGRQLVPPELRDRI